MATRLGNYGITDYTPLMSLVPRSQNFLEEIGLFSEMDTDYLDTEYAEFEREEKGLTAMHTVARGADRQHAGTEQARKEMFRVPFATLDGVTRPQEVQGFREYGTEDTPASVERLVEKKIGHIQRSHARYIRDVMYTAIVDNKVFAVDKDGNEVTSLAKDYSTVWGAPRNTVTIDYTDAAVDPFSKIDEGRTNIIDNAGDNADGYSIVYLVSSAEFNAIITHPLVQAAYDQYPSDQEPLRRRLGMNGDQNRNNRVFEHKGVVVLEDISGKVTAATGGRIFPRGIADFAKAAYAPADTMEHANTISEGSYLFLKEELRYSVIESEVAFMVMLSRPELITDTTITL